MCPTPFRYRHYLFLSIEHAARKYAEKRFDPAEIEKGWHGWRSRLRPELIKLPAQAELLHYRSDDLLDHSNPRQKHFVLEQAIAQALGTGPDAL